MVYKNDSDTRISSQHFIMCAGYKLSIFIFVSLNREVSAPATFDFYLEYVHRNGDLQRLVGPYRQKCYQIM